MRTWCRPPVRRCAPSATSPSCRCRAWAGSSRPTGSAATPSSSAPTAPSRSRRPSGSVTPVDPDAPVPQSSTASSSAGEEDRVLSILGVIRLGSQAADAAGAVTFLFLLITVNIFLGADQPGAAAALRRRPRGHGGLRGHPDRAIAQPALSGRHGPAHADHLRRGVPPGRPRPLVDVPRHREPGAARTRSSRARSTLAPRDAATRGGRTSARSRGQRSPWAATPRSPCSR